MYLLNFIFLPFSTTVALMLISSASNMSSISKSWCGIFKYTAPPSRGRFLLSNLAPARAPNLLKKMSQSLFAYFDSYEIDDDTVPLNCYFLNLIISHFRLLNLTINKRQKYAEKYWIYNYFSIHHLQIQILNKLFNTCRIHDIWDVNICVYCICKNYFLVCH